MRILITLLARKVIRYADTYFIGYPASSDNHRQPARRSLYQIARTLLRCLPPNITGAVTMMAATDSAKRHRSSPNR